MKEGEKGLPGLSCYGVSGTLVAIVYTVNSRGKVRRALEEVGRRAETKGEGDEFRLIVTK